MIKKIFIILLLLFSSIKVYAEAIFDDYISSTGGGMYNSSTKKTYGDFRIDNRFIATYTVDPTEYNIGFKAEAHLLSSYSRNPSSYLSLPINLVIKDDKTNLFNLINTKTYNNNSSYKDTFINKIDRLYFSVFNNNYEVTVGRNTLTWSRARMFHVSDFFNPQIPGFYDGDYKIGTDLVYVNYSLDANRNISLVANPKRNYNTENVTWEDSTFAFRYFQSNETSDYSFSFAQYLRDYVASFGFSSDSIYGSVVRFDGSFVSPEFERNTLYPMLMLGLEKSDYFFDYSTTVFVEYFHNSLGRSSNSHAISYSMQKRLQNEDMFILGKDYLSLGALIEVTPYVNLNYSNVVSLKDASLFNLVSLIYSYSQSLDLGLSYIQPLGKRGDEFGKNCNQNSCQSMGYSLMLKANYSF